MKKKMLAFSAPVGIIIFSIYAIGSRIFGEFPDSIAYPMAVVSVILMCIGIVYNGYCMGKKKNPYDFKEKDI